MFDWLFKNKKEVILIREKNNFVKYNPSIEAKQIIESWFRFNEIESISFEEILSKLDFKYKELLEIEKSAISITNSIWNNPKYIGSIEFTKCINDTSLGNKYIEQVKKTTSGDCKIRHIIHFYKDGIVIDLKYPIDNRYGSDNNKYYLSQVYDLTKDEDGQVHFIEKEQSYRIDRGYPNYIRTYLREEKNDFIELTLIGSANGTSVKTTISIDNPDNKKIYDEKSLLNKLSNCDYRYLGNVFQIIISVIEKDKLNSSTMKIRFIERYETLSNLDYKINKDENSIEISTYDKKIGFKKIYVNNSTEDDLNCRNIIVVYDNKKLVLQVKGVGNISIKNEFSLIEYFLDHFPERNIFKDNSIEEIFLHISTCSFQTPEENLRSVELYRYKDDNLVDSKVWKRYNQIQEDTLEQFENKETLSSLSQEQNESQLVRRLTPTQNIE